MKKPTLILVTALSLFTAFYASAASVDSSFVPESGNYSDASNWSPAQVPNNSGGTTYNVTIQGSSPSEETVTLDIDPTISNLALGTGQLLSIDHSITVTGATTSDTGLGGSVAGIGVNTQNANATFSLGTLTNFSGTALTKGSYDVEDFSNGAHFATIRFTGANIVTLTDATIYLTGAGSRIVDELGHDGLRNLASIQANSILRVSSRNFTTAGNLTNDGTLLIAVDPLVQAPATFTINGSLTNFDPATRTLTNGKLFVDSLGSAAAILRFNGADIVNNQTDINLIGASQILDENGQDGLRHFAHNKENASFGIGGRDFTTGGDFTNDGYLEITTAASSVDNRFVAFVASTFKVNGSLTNLDSATHTLGGTGYITLSGSGSSMATLQFNGANIVNNALNISLLRPARIVDENGNSGLRNLAQNQSGGVLSLLDFDLTVPGDFTNAGNMTIGTQGLGSSSFTVAGGHTYTQIEGAQLFEAETHLAGTLTAGATSIQGGRLVANGTVNSNVAIGAADLVPLGTMTINGNLALFSHAHLHFSLSGTNQGTDYDFIPVSGTATFAGDLEVALNFTPASTDTFTVLTAGSPITGRFDNVVSGGRLNTTGVSGSLIVNYSGNNLVLSGFQAGALPAGKLLNIATRMRVQTGENVLIGGFIITGNDPKKVIIRGIGPSLAQFFTGTLADPTLELYQGNTLLEMNDNWKTRSDGSSQQADVEATGIPPTNDLEAAIVRTLAPGAYTAILRGKGNTAGIGVMEAYDLNQAADSRFGNIATRGFVDTGDNVMIGGLIVGPTSGASAKVLVRAVGPSLSNFGVNGTLQDPTLELHNDSGTLISSNDNWKVRPDGTSQQAEIEDTGLQPSDDRESALVQMVAPGNYTAIVRGMSSGTGVGLVELYNLQ
jgi:hypothetical protein